jgi:hypothetical protein
MAADGVVILNSENQDTALGIGEASHPTRHLITHLPAVARFLGLRRAVKQRFALEVMALIMCEKWRPLSVEQAA